MFMDLLLCIEFDVQLSTLRAELKAMKKKTKSSAAAAAASSTPSSYSAVPKTAAPAPAPTGHAHSGVGGMTLQYLSAAPGMTGFGGAVATGAYPYQRLVPLHYFTLHHCFIDINWLC
jgi:hypothetical protein